MNESADAPASGSDVQEQFRVRKPPSGLTRPERREFKDEEARRLAGLREQARGSGFRAIKATTTPRGLGRSGGRIFREVDRANRARHLEETAALSQGDRAVGAIVLMVAIAGVIAWRVSLGAGSDTPPPTPASSPSVTYHSTSSVADPMGTPQAAVETWLTMTCPSSADDPQSARLARSAPLMTTDGWAAVDHSPTAAGMVWSCSDITADVSTLNPPSDGQAVVYYSAVVSGPSRTRTMREARIVVYQADGTWLVGPLTTAG